MIKSIRQNGYPKKGKLTIKSQEGEKKNPLEKWRDSGREQDSRSGAVILVGSDNNFANVLNESIDVFAEEDEVDDESKRAAETFAVLKACVRAGIHHKFFRESGLGKMGLFPGVGQATGHVGTEGTLADVFCWGVPRFR